MNLKSLFQPQLSRDEVFELQELNRVTNTLNFLLETAKGNTMMLAPDKENFIKNLDGLFQASQNARNTWVSGKLAELGYKDNVNISLRTGKIL